MVDDARWLLKSPVALDAFCRAYLSVCTIRYELGNVVATKAVDCRKFVHGDMTFSLDS